MKETAIPKKGLTEKAEPGKPWWGSELKSVYDARDIADLDPRCDPGAPGEFPYTRGIHPHMYRSKLWTRRQLSGFGSGSRAKERLLFLTKKTGGTGMSIIGDCPNSLGLDSDHPLAAGGVGVDGVPLNSLADMEKMMEGIDPSDPHVSMTLSTPWPTLGAQYIALARRRGIRDLSGLRGTTLMDTLHRNACLGEPYIPPVDLGFKLAVDNCIFFTRQMPLWYPFSLDSYDLREWGITAAQEIGFIFSIAFSYLEKAMESNLDADQVAPGISFTMSAGMNLFEEVAKFRAARRLWAVLLKERYGAENPRSLKLKYFVGAAGSAQVKPQQMNNIIRQSYQALAAVLGGCQALGLCTFTEPTCLPTELSERLALRTQQILAYETGVADTADPLGGSYYVEKLTSVLEEHMREIIQKIDDLGGGYEAVKSGWMTDELRKAAILRQEEIEKGEKIIVGKNAFQMDEADEAEKNMADAFYEIDKEAINDTLNGLKTLKAERDQKALKTAIRHLKNTAENRHENVMPAVIEACEAYATHGEIIGTLREAWGYSYDPFQMIENPII